MVYFELLLEILHHYICIVSFKHSVYQQLFVIKLYMCPSLTKPVLLLRKF